MYKQNKNLASNRNKTVLCVQSKNTNTYINNSSYTKVGSVVFRKNFDGVKKHFGYTFVKTTIFIQFVKICFLKFHRVLRQPPKVKGLANNIRAEDFVVSVKIYDVNRVKYFIIEVKYFFLILRKIFKLCTTT